MKDSMIRHDALDDDDLRRLLAGGQIRYGGNRRLRIYGRLDCASGQRMKREQRVFFCDEVAARSAGFRPCGHCLRDAYRRWRQKADDRASGNRTQNRS